MPGRESAPVRGFLPPCDHLRQLREAHGRPARTGATGDGADGSRAAAIAIHAGQRRRPQDAHLAEIAAERVAEAAVGFRQQFGGEGADRRLGQQPGDLQGGPHVGARQCGRTGFAPIWIQREKSRASIRVACRQEISTAHRNRNQRSNAIPYERCVVADRPAACNSPKYAATAATGSPAESSSRYGLPRITGRRQRPPPGNHQRPQIPRRLFTFDHGQRP